MTNQQETLYAIALAQLCRYSPTTALQLYKEGGSATTLMEHRHNIKTLFPNANTRLIETFRQADQALRQAEKELKYNIEHNIKTLLINDEDYPARLRECTDAPLVIFYKGTATLNPTHAIAIVGTRRCTTYGQDITRRFIKDLQNHCPGILIVSGLAYGIDICAHREALAEKNETIGVLAHGLDQLYPAHHKQTAQEMTKQGGLLTEFMTETQAEKMHFVQRNRIVAGMCDACIVVESGERGGSLITADIARSYDRDVFAFPGRVGDKTSAGCNRLIRDNVAALIQNADDLIKAMRWENINLLKQAKQTGIQPQLFPELTPDEQKIIKTLNEKNDQQMNTLAVNCYP